MELAAVATLMQSLKTAIDVAKLISSSSGMLEKAETKMQLAQLIEALSEAKIQIADVRLLLVDKDEQLAKLEAELKAQADVYWEDPFYWAKRGESKDGPFCQKCHDSEGKLVRLLKNRNAPGAWRCTVCKQGFGVGRETRPRTAITRDDPWS